MNRPGWENADTCAQKRTRVQQLARSDWRRALELAREIPLAWYRVQSLAAVAKHAAEDRVDSVLSSARAEAAKETDAYRRNAVLVWVVEAALARGRTETARSIAHGILNNAGAITPVKSRAEALYLLLPQAVSIDRGTSQVVADALLKAAQILRADPVKRWRKWGTSYINRTAWILGKADSQLASRLLAHSLGEERAREVLSRHG